MNVNKITDMIAKHSTTPNAAAHEKTKHLWDEPRLGGYNLINQDTVARKNVLRATNGT